MKTMSETVKTLIERQMNIVALESQAYAMLQDQQKSYLDIAMVVPEASQIFTGVTMMAAHKNMELECHQKVLEALKRLYKDVKEVEESN
jgi:predicted class III extradiol MEMO1 family dioxygenase